jgi:oxygen-dependent protoporphyrinogen oxidase
VTGGGVEVSVGEGREAYDAVVVATPGPVARTLLRGAEPRLAGWLEGVRTRPAVSVAFLLDRPAGGRFFGLSLPRDESTTVAAMCLQENKGVDLVPAGSGALVALLRPDVAPGLLDAPSPALVDAVLPDVRRAFPNLEPHIRRARVYRWPWGNPVVYPGYLAHLGAFRAGVEGDGPVALAGDYLYTPSVEGAITAGSAAARRLLERLG